MNIFELINRLYSSNRRLPYVDRHSPARLPAQSQSEVLTSGKPSSCTCSESLILFVTVQTVPSTTSSSEQSEDSRLRSDKLKRNRVHTQRCDQQAAFPSGTCRAGASPPVGWLVTVARVAWPMHLPLIPCWSRVVSAALLSSLFDRAFLELWTSGQTGNSKKGNCMERWKNQERVLYLERAMKRIRGRRRSPRRS